MIYSGYVYDKKNALLVLGCVHRAIAFKLVCNTIKHLSRDSGIVIFENLNAPTFQTDDPEAYKSVLENCIATARVQLLGRCIKNIIVVAECNLGFIGQAIFPRFLSEPKYFSPLFTAINQGNQQVIRLLITSSEAIQLASQKQFHFHHALDQVLWAQLIKESVLELYEALLVDQAVSEIEIESTQVLAPEAQTMAEARSSLGVTSPVLSEREADLELERHDNSTVMYTTESNRQHAVNSCFYRVLIKPIASLFWSIREKHHRVHPLNDAERANSLGRSVEEEITIPSHSLWLSFSSSPASSSMKSANISLGTDYSSTDGARVMPLSIKKR